MTRNLAIYNVVENSLYTEYKYGSKDLTAATGVRQVPQTRTDLPICPVKGLQRAGQRPLHPRTDLPSCCPIKGLLRVGQKPQYDISKSNGCCLNFEDISMPSKENLNSYYLEELEKYSNKDIMKEPRKRSKYIHNDRLACKCGEGKSCMKNQEIYKNIVHDSWLRCCLESGLIRERRSKHDALSVLNSSGGYEYNSLWGDAGRQSNVSYSPPPPEFTPSDPFSNSFGHTTT